MEEAREDDNGRTLAIVGSGKMGTAILKGMLAHQHHQHHQHHEPKAAIAAATTTAITTTAPITRYLACVRTASSAERLRAQFAAELQLDDEVNNDDNNDRRSRSGQRRLTILQDDNLRAFQTADVILLACKPYAAAAVLGAPGVRDALRRKLVISVLAGSASAPDRLLRLIYGDSGGGSGGGPLSDEREREHEHDDRCRVVRATPNVAAALGSSMTLIEADDADATAAAAAAGNHHAPPLPRDLHDLTTWIFSRVGQVQHVKATDFDAASTLTGAGIAFLTIAVDGLLDGAVAEGLKRADARLLLAHTLTGLADLLVAGAHPAVLREEIASPSGTTIRGLLALEKAAVRASFSGALMDAVHRTRAM